MFAALAAFLGRLLRSIREVFMIGALAKRMFGSANDRYVTDLQTYVDAINALEPEFEAMSDEKIRERTESFRRRGFPPLFG